MKRTLRGLRVRLTFIYSTLFGFFICVFAFILSNQYLDLLRSDFDAALLNFGLDISSNETITPGYKGPKISEYESRKLFPFSLGSTVYVLRSIEGNVVGGSADKPQDMVIPYRSDLPRSPDYTHRFLSLVYRDIEYRAVNIKLTNAEGHVQILQVAAPAQILKEQKQKLILINLLSIPLLIVISSLLSFLFAGNALRPIKVLTDAARSIAAENLSQRVPETDTKDEVSELSRTFNNLLVRLEKSFRAQENFVANASHQLNTPLSIIKGELDLLESKNDRTPDEVARFRHSLREELERLIDLVKKMLLISRVEAGHENFIMRAQRVDEILLHTTSRLNALARGKKITIRFNISDSFDVDSLIVKGDRQLLDAMFENILENAIKYSPEETVVTIDVMKASGKIEVAVSDEGPGMTLKEWEKIAQGRFNRGTEISLPGTGIGLSIVQSIAELHRAQLDYRPKDGRGSTFVITFPQQKIL
ncbi:MAG: sensor histidine kinase [Bacteriovoracaceae bacterium]